ncbi:hypothetical protein ACJX0J_041018, partial [Zea mays]
LRGSTIDEASPSPPASSPSKKSGELLNTEAPDLYIRQNPVPNAYTLAINGKKPFIVVHTSLVELLTPRELQAVLAHELGHLKCDHGVWLTFANILTMGAYTVPGFGMVAGFLEEQLYRWLRAAELTCDRAALLVVQDPKPRDGGGLRAGSVAQGVPREGAGGDLQIKSFLSAYTLFHLGFMVGYMRVAFAYVCGQRTTRAINPHAYTNETVFVQRWSSACWTARASTTPSARCSTKCRSRLDVRAYTTVLHALSRAGRYERTLELFAELRRQGVAPTLVTYNVVLDVYGRMGRSWPRIVTLLDEMRAAGVETDGFTASMVIAACCRDGLVDEAVASTIELYIEYQKERVHMVDDARLSTVLSKEGIEVCMVPSADRMMPNLLYHFWSLTLTLPLPNSPLDYLHLTISLVVIDQIFVGMSNIECYRKELELKLYRPPPPTLRILARNRLKSWRRAATVSASVPCRTAEICPGLGYSAVM